ncbi:MFS transporter [Pseudomonas sp. LA21]|uniref:MFS transporter n=1 Tax=unclassified Pseudomonas TaxID=196821 RepID=UPI001FB60A2C|nr:MFS transporter [Pseudomonas sp. LA21]MCJ1886510.1 MFS transporter [Pseudomonas sp. LA21]
MHNNNTRGLRAALIYIAATALIVIGVQPILIGLFSERLSLDLSQQGWLLSSDMAGILLGTLLLPAVERRIGGRGLYLCAALATAAFNITSATLDGFASLLACRCACGVGAGLLYAGAINALGRLPGQDRSYGLTLLLQTLVFAAFAANLPVLAVAVGDSLALASIGIWFVLIALVCLAIPAQLRSEGPARNAGSGVGSARIGRFALLGMLCLQLAIYCIWGFIDQLGRERGIGAIDIGWAFGLGVLGGLPGAALPSLLGGRVSRGPMIGLGSLLVLASIIMLDGYTSTGRQLCAALFLMNFGWVLALTYYMSSISTNDPRGNLTQLVSVVQSGAATIAPALIAVLLQRTDHEAIFLTSGLAVIAGFGLKCAAGVSVRRSASEG